MVKFVVGDETQLKSAEDRLSQSSISVEVGIIVGKINLHLERGFVYDLIPTPPTDGGIPACSLKSESGSRDDRKKGSKGGKPSAEAIPSLLIDGEWVAEHARQVSRMLLGGMSVIGIYVWSSEASFKATSASLLTQAIRVVAEATPSFDSETNERLLIHISYSPKRWACRNCAVASVELRPCDFKMSKLLALLQTYRCIYSFDIRCRIPAFQDLVSTSNTFKNIVRSGISGHAKELQSARALLDGRLVAENQQVPSEGLHNIELLLPFKSDAHHGSLDNIAGLVVFKGAICAYTYLSPKEPASQAISDIKNDIINSLNSRLDIILDMGEDTLDMASNDIGKVNGEIVNRKPIQQLNLQEMRKPVVLSFPRRVLVPWLSGIFICDYLLPSETCEDLNVRCRDFLSMETPVESTGLLELETEAVLSISSSFWDVVRGYPILSNEESKNRSHSLERKASKKSKYFNFNLQVALFVLLLAVLIGGSLIVFNPANVKFTNLARPGAGAIFSA